MASGKPAAGAVGHPGAEVRIEMAKAGGGRGFSAIMPGLKTRPTATMPGVKTRPTAMTPGLKTRPTAMTPGVKTRPTAMMPGLKTRPTVGKHALSTFTRVAISALVVAAALSVGVGATQAPDRSKPPASGPVPVLKLPAIQKQALSNGLP